MVSLRSRFLNPFVISSFVLILFFYSGLFIFNQKNPFRSLNSIEKVCYLKGFINSNPTKNLSKDYYTFSLKVEESKALLCGYEVSSSSNGIVNLMVPSSIVENLNPGRLYSISDGYGIFEKGEEFEFSGYYSSRQNRFVVEKSCYLGYKESFTGKIFHFRSLMRLKFKRLLYSWNEAGAFILALLAGSKEYLEEDFAKCFMLAGLSHLLALSGMHLSFFASLTDVTGSKLFGIKYSYWAKLLGILFFVWFAGFSPSLFRAFICSFLMIVCLSSKGNRCDYFLILCFTFIFHSVVRFNDVYTVGFMLSYLALTGILLFSEYFTTILNRFFTPKVSSSLGASISAQLFTIPVSIKYFGAFMPIGIISTVVVSPLVSIFLTLSVLMVILSLMFPFLSNFCGQILNVLYKIIRFLVKYFSLFPAIKF